jgi:SAM-dependent methyltransferase
MSGTQRTSSSSMTWEESVRWLLSQPQYEQIVKDCYYDQPLETAFQRYIASEEWRAVKSLLPSGGGAAVDIGAGNGITSVALASMGFSVVAVEPDPSQLVGRSAIASLAAAVGVALQVEDGTLESLPLPDRAADLVFTRQVLHHARDLPRAAKEVHRVLRPGGAVIAIRDHVISSERQLPSFLESHPLHRLYGGENAYTEAFYAACLEGAGLRVVKRLRSFDSPVNFAPHTRDTLREALVSRVPGPRILGQFLGAIAGNPRVFDFMLRLMSVIDFRPGRLVSFVAIRPVE